MSGQWTGGRTWPGRMLEALYRFCLEAYPAGFRRTFGPAMRRTFRDAIEEAESEGGGWRFVVLWLRTIADLVRSVAREHAEVMGARRREWRSPAWTPDAAMRVSRTGRMTMQNVGDEIRWAIRSYRRQPGFAVIAILTLALGIGANTALFSVVRTALLEPLPYRDPSSVAMIWSQWSNFDKTWVSEPEFHNYRASLHTFEDIGLFYTDEASITEGDEPERVATTQMMPNVLPILGVSPIIGRGFTDEDANPNGATTVMLSYDLWQRRFGGDASVLGSALSVNGRPYEILGVLPAGFRLPLDYKTDRPTALWLPYPVSQPGPLVFGGGSHGSYAIGRMRPGATVAAANADLKAVVAAAYEQQLYPVDWHFQAFAVTAQSEVSGSLRPALMVLLGAVGLVLLIACVNVANLLLVRAEGRRTEIGVRAAVGASGSRLTRLLLIENGVLAAAGGVTGVGIAWAGLYAVRRLAPSGLPRVAEAHIDGGVLAFTGLVALGTAALFGLLPALNAARTDTRSVLSEGGRANTPGSARSRVRRALIALEVALAVVIAVGAGLMLRSFSRLISIDPGFRTENLLTMRISTPSAFYADDPSVSGFYARLLEGVRALPGVRSAALIRLLPIDQEIGDSCIQVDGYTPADGLCAAADWQAASDGYFETMGQDVLEGRGIQAGDVTDAQQVIVVNEEFVRRYIPDGNAIGRGVRFAFTQTAPPQTIVGVVANTHHNGITNTPKAAFYRPLAQWAVSTGNPQRTVALVIRTERDPRGFIAPVRGVIRGLDSRLPLAGVQTMDDVMVRATAQPRFTLMLLLAFGGLALLLAVIGIYGVVSFAVASRNHELGIRMALGASPRSVIWLSLKHGLSWALVGIGAGTASALVAARLLGNLVYEVTTHDPLTYAAVIGLALLVSTGASWVPARRASKADPLAALRARSA